MARRVMDFEIRSKNTWSRVEAVLADLHAYYHIDARKPNNGVELRLGRAFSFGEMAEVPTIEIWVS